MKDKRLLLLREIIAGYSEKHTHSEEKSSFMVLKQVIYIVAFVF
jgi:hypothetical protein